MMSGNDLNLALSLYFDEEKNLDPVEEF